MDLSGQLVLFAQLKDPETSGKILIKIIENILKHPNEPKYRDLNLIGTSNKLKGCKVCIDLLFMIGFKKSVNGKRLLLDMNQSLKPLKSLRDNILTIISTSNWSNNNSTEDMKLDENMDDEIVNAALDILAENKQDDILSAILNDFEIEIRGRGKTNIEILEELINSFRKIDQGVISYNSQQLFDNKCHLYEANSCVLADISPFTDIIFNKLTQAITKNDELRNTASKFVTYIIEEEYDTDALINDLYRISESNIMNHLYDINKDIEEMKERGAKTMNPFQKMLCELINTNESNVQCSSLKRICKMLKLYDKYLKEQNAKNDTKINIYEYVYGAIDVDYGNVELLNDFNHLIHCHSDSFEDIYDILAREVYGDSDNPCDLSKCLLMRRNQRDRMKESENINLYFTVNEKEIMAHQLIERIHCHFIHSFDIGYKISKQERDGIINKDFNQRSKWDVGSEVFIYSETENKWKKGKVVKIYHDDEGEWLVIRYHINDIIKTKEIGRFSKYIQPIDHNFGTDRFVLEISKLLQNKKNKYRKVPGLQRIYSGHNKYISNQYNPENSNLDEYAFGFRFFYHECYKDNNQISDPATAGSSMGGLLGQHPANEGYTLSDMYITRKYNTFKEEMQNNEICSLKAGVWNNLYLKATVHILTGRALQFVCPRGKSAEYYEMKTGDGITCDHLIAIMIYCNYDTLQRKFSETFRSINDESIRNGWKLGDTVSIYSNGRQKWFEGKIIEIFKDKKGFEWLRVHFGSYSKEVGRYNYNIIGASLCGIKQNHSNYYFLGRLLRECVECFGMDYNKKNTLALYHGASHIFKFQSLFAYIKGPFSTTTDYAVAVNFSDNSGVILTLDINVKSWIFEGLEGQPAAERISCFDCQWISDYPNESEIFCIGGLNRFYFNSIIHTNGANYCKYIKGIKQMTTGMTHFGISADVMDLDIPETMDEIQMVYRLLSHQFYKYIPHHKHAHKLQSCPKYIDELLDSHCNDIKCIYFVENVQHKVLDALLRDEHGWIKLDVITKIFPSCNSIHYHATNKDFKFVTNRRIFDSILEQMNTNNNLKLKYLSLHINPKFQTQIERFINEDYPKKLKQRGCRVTCYYQNIIKTLSDKSGLDIVRYIKIANKDQNMKRMGDHFLKNLFNGANLLEAFTGIQDFDIWKDYEKLERSYLDIHITK